jgi:hypothetical protein
MCCMRNLLHHIKYHWAFFAVFSLLIIVGLSIYKDYGISADEGTQREIAWKSIDYVINGNDELLNYTDRDYGVAFEAPLLALEILLFDLDAYHQIYPFRHLIIHLFFLLGVVFMYLTAHILFKNKWLALASVLLFVLHPRIYAHSFFNSKDIPFLVMLIITIYFGVKAVYSKKTLWFVLFGIASGLLVNLRIIGALFPVLLASYYFIENRKNVKKTHLHLLIALITGMLTLYASWPYLWKNPIGNFMAAISNMSKFRWENDLNLFFGNFISARELPWLYLPSWIGITTPAIILALFLIGSVYSFKKSRLFQLLLLILLLPICLVIGFNSVLYDGWRHFYFLYPLIVIIATLGLSFLLTKISTTKTYGLLTLGILPVVYFSISNHPYQQVYFNELVSKKEHHLLHQFERDYWGASFYKGLQQLSEIAYEDTIVFTSNIKSGYMNTLLFKPNEKPYFKYVSSVDSADYYITNYRWNLSDYTYEEKLFDISVQNSPIISAWKIK